VHFFGGAVEAEDGDDVAFGGALAVFWKPKLGYQR